MSETPRPAAPAPARKVPRLLSCLVKGPLGCLAFLLGALVVLVLFLPPVLGRLADRSLETWFNQSHLGTLETTEVWLGSLYGPQRIESLIVRDPEGQEVLRASVRAPSLGPVLFDDDDDYGPVSIRVASLRIVRERDGGTNLGHAFAHRPGASSVVSTYGGALRFSSDDMRLNVPVPIEIELVIDRLRYADAQGQEGLLEKLALRGELELSSRGATLELEGGADSGAVRVQLKAGELRGESGRPWRFELDAEHLPAALLDLLLGSGALLERVAGPRIERARVVWWNAAGGERALEELALDTQELSLSLRSGRTRERALVSGEDGRAQLEFTSESWCARRLLPELVPVIGEVRALEPDGRFALSASRFSLPLDADLARLDARVELGYPRALWTLDGSALLALPADPSDAEPAPSPFRRRAPLAAAAGTLAVEVAGGTVSLAAQEIPCEEGALALDGSYELVTRRYRALSVALDLGPERASSAVLEGERRGGELPAPPGTPELPGGR